MHGEVLKLNLVFFEIRFSVLQLLSKDLNLISQFTVDFQQFAFYFGHEMWLKFPKRHRILLLNYMQHLVSSLLSPALLCCASNQ